MRLDYTFMMKEAVDGGIDKFDFPSAAFNAVVSGMGKGWQQWCDLASDEEIAKIVEFSAPICAKCDSVVVLGIGGSALGVEAIANALLHLHHNELCRAKRNAPKLYVEDNVDPDRMSALFDVVDADNSLFMVITKSGETSETLSQFLYIYDLLKKRLGERAKEHIVAITTIGKGTLYNIAQKEGFALFGIKEGVGGRFSVFSPVGLVPLACVGVDIKALIEGARRAREYCTRAENNPALIMASLSIRAYEMGRNISVIMPYCDSLRLVGDFYAQLWGESLGKIKNGSIRVGQTPVKALGVTDQHSQIQLYTQGPLDKIVTFIKVKRFKTEQTIPFCEGEPSFLMGKTFNELISAECDATAFALKKAGRMNMTLEIDDLSAGSIGELLTVLMYETAYAGAILGINTYDQPGVEEGKKATFAMMGRLGYEDKLKEIKSATCGKYISEN